jgi:hypothetical protein
MKFDLKPVWIDVDEAIRRNKISRLNGVGTEYWIDQELYVLQYIRDKMKDGGFGKDGVYRLASV